MHLIKKSEVTDAKIKTLFKLENNYHAITTVLSGWCKVFLLSVEQNLMIKHQILSFWANN